MGGKFHLKLNANSRLIEYKYHEGKVKRTLKRELKVPEISGTKSGWNQWFAARLSRIDARAFRGSVSIAICFELTMRGGSFCGCQRQFAFGARPVFPENCSWAVGGS